MSTAKPRGGVEDDEDVISKSVVDRVERMSKRRDPHRVYLSTYLGQGRADRAPTWKSQAKPVFCPGLADSITRAPIVSAGPIQPGKEPQVSPVAAALSVATSKLMLEEKTLKIIQDALIDVDAVERKKLCDMAEVLEAEAQSTRISIHQLVNEDMPIIPAEPATAAAAAAAETCNARSKLLQNLLTLDQEAAELISQLQAVRDKQWTVLQQLRAEMALDAV